MRCIFRKLRRSSRRWLKKVGTLNIVLFCVGLFFVWFNCQMLEIFKAYGSIPETYACAVVAATIGEAGVCGWIRTNKDKQQSRRWDKEDMRKGKTPPPDGYNTGL